MARLCRAMVQVKCRMAGERHEWNAHILSVSVWFPGCLVALSSKDVTCYRLALLV